MVSVSYTVTYRYRYIYIYIYTRNSLSCRGWRSCSASSRFRRPWNQLQHGVDVIHKLHIYIYIYIYIYIPGTVRPVAAAGVAQPRLASDGRGTSCNMLSVSYTSYIYIYIYTRNSLSCRGWRNCSASSRFRRPWNQLQHAVSIIHKLHIYIH